MKTRKVVLFSAVRDREIYTPLSILTLASTLAAEGFEVVLLDVQVDDDWQARVARECADAFLFGASCLTSPSIRSVMEAIEIARAANHDIRVVWGGYHATLAAGAILRERLADFVVRGQGERAISALAHALADGDGDELRDRLAAVPNLGRWRDGEMVIGPIEPIGDMNALPPLDYDLLDLDKYFTDDARELSYITSYGCPWACTFCSEPRFSGRRWQPLAAERVAEEAIALRDRYGLTLLNIMDPNFSSNAARVVEIVRALQRRNACVPIMCDMRANDILRIARLIDFAELRAVGFQKIYIGVESGSDRVLTALKKGQSAADPLEACRLLDRAGIATYTSFIHDLPQETEQDSDATFALVEKLCALEHNRQFHHFFLPFPSTEIYDSLVAGSEQEWERPQAEWANSSTFHGNTAWGGRFSFRKSVMRRLFDLRGRYPHAFRHPATLPVLKRLAS